MTQASRDDNQVTTMLGVLNTDGATPTPVKADPTAHNITTQDAKTGSDFGADRAKRDDNGVPTLMAASNVDGATPVQLYVDSSGQLLIDST